MARLNNFIAQDLRIPPLFYSQIFFVFGVSCKLLGASHLRHLWRFLRQENFCFGYVPLCTRPRKNLSFLQIAQKIVVCVSPVAVILILIFCSSCNKSIAKYLPGRPSASFKKALQDSSPEFRQGWKDGCEVGMSGGANTFYKMFYDNNAVDGYKMTSSSEYKNAWGNAFWYCYRYDYIKQKSAIWSSMFRGYR